MLVPQSKLKKINVSDTKNHTSTKLKIQNFLMFSFQLFYIYEKNESLKSYFQFFETLKKLKVQNFKMFYFRLFYIYEKNEI